MGHLWRGFVAIVLATIHIYDGVAIGGSRFLVVRVPRYPGWHC